MNQTFNYIEYLFVDDGSEDDSTKIIHDYQLSHLRGKEIRLIQQPHNYGCWAARNMILNEAKGKYIYMMDSDDYISLDCIEKLFTAAEKYNTEATYGSYRKDINGDISNGFTYKFKRFTHQDELASYANLKFQITITNYVWNILFRTDFIRNHHLKFAKTNLWEDVLFNADLQPLIEKAVLLPEITYTYVIHDNSLSGHQNRKEINFNEIKCHFNNNIYLKNQCKKLVGKPYFEMRCAKVMLQAYYSVVGALRNKNKISPSITNKELVKEMESPFSFVEIIHFKRHKLENLIFYLLGILPTFISLWLIIITAKYKKLL